jgi:hypothetical protein
MLMTQFKYTGPMKQKLVGFNKALKSALSEALAWWHQKFLPIHFQKNAYYRYRGIFKRRHGIVENGKLLTKAQVRVRTGDDKKSVLREPMLISGTLKRNVTKQINVTGSVKNMKGRLPGSNVANFFPNAKADYNMREELTAINKAEEKEMDKIVDERMTAFIADKSKTETVTI